MYRCLFYVHDACWWNASITEFLRCCAVVRAPITLAPKILALTQDRIGAAGPPHAPREEPLSEERSDLRSAGGFLDEERVICNHGFGTNLLFRKPQNGIGFNGIADANDRVWDLT